jgi:hypothetical protein
MELEIKGVTNGFNSIARTGNLNLQTLDNDGNVMDIAPLAFTETLTARVITGMIPARSVIFVDGQTDITL